jgi:nickel superoxide dismutase
MKKKPRDERREEMKKEFFQMLIMVVAVFLTVSFAAAHCEIPCGIYDDEARIDMLAEHITTMEKSMKMIIGLGKTKPINYNQLVRWITNKEDHADAFQEIVSRYFMTQRIKPDMKNYNKLLTALHQMLVSAMKCKQTTDLANIETLRTLLKELRMLYLGQGH